jgi:hypothetical protein
LILHSKVQIVKTLAAHLDNLDCAVFYQSAAVALLFR